jgi:hypothetical protein
VEIGTHPSTPGNTQSKIAELRIDD